MAQYLNLTQVTNPVAQTIRITEPGGVVLTGVGRCVVHWSVGVRVAVVPAGRIRVAVVFGDRPRLSVRGSGVVRGVGRR